MKMKILENRNENHLEKILKNKYAVQRQFLNKFLT